MDHVLQPRPLAVGPVPEVAKDLEHGLADLEHSLRGDVAERDRKERESLLGARRRAQAPADEHVVAGDLAIFDDRQKAQVVGVDISAVIVRKGERRLELARQVRLAVKGLDGVVGRRCTSAGPAGGRVSIFSPSSQISQ